MLIDLVNWKRKLDRLSSQYSYSSQKVQEERQALQKAKEHALDVSEAQKIVQDVAANVQQAAHRQIASVVTRCLEAVFPDEGYKFKILFRKRYGKTDAKLVIQKGEHEIDSPQDEEAGGVVGVVVLGLRLAQLMLTRPARRRILMLDEPLANLSKDYLPAVRDLLITLSKELGIQMILITHERQLQVGKVIELG